MTTRCSPFLALTIIIWQSWVFLDLPHLPKRARFLATFRYTTGRNYVGLLMKKWTTWLWQCLHLAHFMGQDVWGNRYYQSASGGLRGVLGARERPRRPRRWVLYAGRAEASKVPPAWHGWLHYITDAPMVEDLSALPLPNLTGTRLKNYFMPQSNGACAEDISVTFHQTRVNGYSAWAPPKKMRVE